MFNPPEYLYRLPPLLPAVYIEYTIDSSAKCSMMCKYFTVNAKVKVSLVSAMQIRCIGLVA
jgi:hypothetical protein